MPYTKLLDTPHLQLWLFQSTTSSICALLSCRLGKVVQANDSNDHIPGLYVCGWVKRGPSGIIGKTPRHLTSVCLSSIHAGSPVCTNMTWVWEDQMWQTCLHAGAAKIQRLFNLLWKWQQGWKLQPGLDSAQPLAFPLSRVDMGHAHGYRNKSVGCAADCRFDHWGFPSRSSSTSKPEVKDTAIATEQTDSCGLSGLLQDWQIWSGARP